MYVLENLHSYKENQNEKNLQAHRPAGFSAQGHLFPPVLLPQHHPYHVSSQADKCHGWPDTKTPTPEN